MKRLLRCSVCLALLAACAPEAPEEVWRELAGEVGWAEGRLGPVPTSGEGPLRAIVQERSGTIDFVFEAPREGRLRFETPDGSPQKGTRVTLASESGEETEVVPARKSGGAEVSLADFENQLVRVRFENSSGEPRSWVAPRVLGKADPAPAPLVPPKRESGTRPNVLLYVVDALRPDHLSVYGYGLPTSPRLEAFAQQATVFENAYSAGPSTIETIPTLLTSLFRSEIDGRLRPGPDAVPHTVAEVFRAAGYETAAFQANFRLRKSLGFSRGFDPYRMVTEPGVPWFPRANAEKLHAEVIEWLDQPREKPFFLYVHSLDVHHPYEPPAPFFGRFSHHRAPMSAEEMLRVIPEAVLGMDAASQSVYRKVIPTVKPEHYDDGVAYADHTLGQLFDALEARGHLDDTAIFLTADHGESLGEGGRFIHGLSLNEELVRVPLIARLPGQREARRVASVVSHLDVAPTLVDLAGIEPPRAFRGRSLVREFEAPGFALGEMGFERFYVRVGPWKLMRDARGANLYHLPDDPAEARDRASENPLRVNYLTQYLWQHSPGFRRDTAVRRLDEHLDGEERLKLDEALRALGYIE